MSAHLRSGLLYGLLYLPVVALGAEQESLESIQEQIRLMQVEYEQRISALEDKLVQAQAAQQARQAAVEKGNANRVLRDNSFNPSIGVILNARYATFENDPSEAPAVGVSFGPESGVGSEGLSIGESEITLSANVDDLFYGSLTAALADEDGEISVELEEAYVQTVGLSRGWTVKAGRFFSGIGYLNQFHAHTLDFLDRPLPYRSLLANQYADDGVQLRWLAPTEHYLEFGSELFRGSRYPAGGSVHDGVGAYSIFARFGGDIDVSNSFVAGISYLNGDAEMRSSGAEETPDSFSGEHQLWVADMVWKWAPNGDARHRNFKAQMEYFYSNEQGLFAPQGGADLALDRSVRGWYLQGVYQFMPRWRFGMRYAQLQLGALDNQFDGTLLDAGGVRPNHTSVMFEWANSEFSKIRLQYNFDESQPDRDHQFFLQYVMSIGAHGAHSF